MATRPKQGGASRLSNLAGFLSLIVALAIGSAPLWPIIAS